MEEISRLLKEYSAARTREERAGLANALGIAYFHEGDYEQAITYHTQELELREDAEVLDRAIALRFLGLSHKGLGQPKVAQQRYEEGLALAEQLGYSMELQRAHCNLGNLLIDLYEEETTAQVHRPEEYALPSEAMADFPSSGEEHMSKRARRKKTERLFAQGMQHLKLSLEIAQGLTKGELAAEQETLEGKEKILCEVLFNIGNGLYVRGVQGGGRHAHEALQDSLRYLHMSIKIAVAHRFRDTLGKAYMTIGLILKHQGSYEEAEKYIQLDIEICKSNEDWPGVIVSCKNLALVLRSQRRYSAALQAVQQAVEIGTKHRLVDFTEETIHDCQEAIHAEFEVYQRQQELIRESESSEPLDASRKHGLLQELVSISHQQLKDTPNTIKYAKLLIDHILKCMDYSKNTHTLHELCGLQLVLAQAYKAALKFTEAKATLEAALSLLRPAEDSDAIVAAVYLEYATLLEKKLFKSPQESIVAAYEKTVEVANGCNSNNTSCTALGRLLHFYEKQGNDAMAQRLSVRIRQVASNPHPFLPPQWGTAKVTNTNTNTIQETTTKMKTNFSTLTSMRTETESESEPDTAAATATATATEDAKANANANRVKSGNTNGIEGGRGLREVGGLSRTVVPIAFKDKIVEVAVPSTVTTVCELQKFLEWSVANMQQCQQCPYAGYRRLKPIFELQLSTATGYTPLHERTELPIDRHKLLAKMVYNPSTLDVNGLLLDEAQSCGLASVREGLSNRYTPVASEHGEVLVLQSFELESKELAVVIRTLVQLPLLRELNLAEVGLGSRALHHLCAVWDDLETHQSAHKGELSFRFCSLAALQVLNISRNFAVIEDPDMLISFFSCVKERCQLLVSLNVSFIPFGMLAERECKAVEEAIILGARLRTLDISSCELKTWHCSQCESLRELSLAWNFALVVTLSNLSESYPALTKLNISGCHCTATEKGVSCSHPLNEIIAHNLDGIVGLLGQLSRAGSLARLNLQYNQLSPEDSRLLELFTATHSHSQCQIIHTPLS